jgi:hypothetical protein
MHIDITFYTVFVPRIWFQASAQPPAKKTAGQIEKETEVSYKRRLGRERPV